MKTSLTKYVVFVVAGIASFLAPLVPTLIFVGAISIADFITGLMKAHKSNTVQSARMIHKLYAAVGYFIGILIAHGMEIYFGGEVPFVKAVVAIIALTEIQSVRENIKEISGVDILSPIVNVLQKRVSNDNK